MGGPLTDQQGSTLRQFRLRARLTQEALAEASGVSVRTIRGLESGARRNPQRSSLQQLADAMGLSPGDRELLMAAVLGTPAAPGPRQLPAPPTLFAGRRPDVAELTEMLDQTSTVVISGTGGVGKTWLALHWANQESDRFPDGQLYVNLRGFDPSGRPMNVEAALRGFLEGIGVPPSEQPTDLHAQSALYRSLLADRRMLVLIDNAVDSAQVVPLLPGSGSTVIVTSRNQLTGLVTSRGARRLTLDALPDEDSTALLAARLGADRLAAEPDAAAQLVRSCAGMPLALGIVAGRAQAHPEFPLAELADELREMRLNALDEDDELASVRAVLSWSTTPLKPPMSRLFTLLGIVPGPDIGVQAAAALNGQSVMDTRRLLRALEQVSLVQHHVPGRYRMHDLVRLYAAEQTLPQAEREAALHGLVTYYTAGARAVNQSLFPHRAPSVVVHDAAVSHEFVPSDADAAWAWFHAENACLVASARLAMTMGWYAPVWEQAYCLAPMRTRQGYLHDDHETWRMALAAAEHLGDTVARGLALCGLGFADHHLNDNENAALHQQEAVDLLATTDRTMEQAIAHSALSNALRPLDRVQEGLRHARRSLELLEPLGHPVLTAQALSQVGEHQLDLGDYAVGRATLERALAVFREHGDTDSAAITLSNIARSLRREGEFAAALPLYHEVLALYTAVGNLANIGAVHASIGDIQLAQGDRDGAAQSWRTALEVHIAHHQLSLAEETERKLAKLTPRVPPSVTPNV
ncbi:ATP-binding protein [Kutzneria chonburiensis]|uniref:ATP-binding protein n=1 Tax=Kutzneria chonburiensis TaxID=1483604 RepID=UPI0023625CA8|nr:helix-turn-helix domain-containing protein [Kutzneria chonburiensis]